MTELTVQAGRGADQGKVVVYALDENAPAAMAATPVVTLTPEEARGLAGRLIAVVLSITHEEQGR